LFTFVAYNDYLSHNALAGPGGIICFNHFANKFMSENASIGLITFDPFKVGTANSRFSNLD